MSRLELRSQAAVRAASSGTCRREPGLEQLVACHVRMPGTDVTKEVPTPAQTRCFGQLGVAWSLVLCKSRTNCLNVSECVFVTLKHPLRSLPRRTWKTVFPFVFPLKTQQSFCKYTLFYFVYSHNDNKYEL